MGFLEIETSKATYYIQCIKYYKDEENVIIQYFNGKNIDILKFEKKENFPFIVYYKNEKNPEEYLKSVKKDNGRYLYKAM